MIEKAAKKISILQGEKPYLFLIIFGIITLVLIPGIFNLVGNVEPSLEKVLPQNIQEVKTMNDMRSEFGADMMYIIAYPVAPIVDARNPAYLNYINLLEQRIIHHDAILKTESLAGEVKYFGGETIPDSISEIKSFPLSKRFVNDDYSLSIIQIKSDTGSSSERIKDTVDAIKADIEALEEINPGVSVEITGFNAIDKATFEVIISDFGSITIVSMILVMLVVFTVFRSFIKGMMPMAVVMTSLIWTAGIAGYLNLTITVVSMVSAAMIMGLGIDFGIHVVHTYFEKRKSRNPKSALSDTLGELLRAMTGASLTTMAGFLALLFGVLPAMKTLSIILALGIFNTLLGAVFLLPVIVYLYDRGK
ncbi:MAG: MMPL family transporter [Nanoarchaeota archaeon]|jgi:predicted RND superfamily exporter protein|nr:MMPL family transporter [Nanoarchaeota archaeon]